MRAYAFRFEGCVDVAGNWSSHFPHTDAAGLNLASFRKSSELEFGADDAFILAPDAKHADVVSLMHLKARHGEQRDIALTFDKTHQAFTPLDGTTATQETDGKLQAALWNLWGSTAPAGDDTDRGTDDEF